MVAMLFALHSGFLKAENSNIAGSMTFEKKEMVYLTSARTSQATLSIPKAEMAAEGSSEAVQTAYANTLLDRLNQINEMDMSVMGSSEKIELRKEVRAIQKELGPSGGIYISVGAAILIVLLLILLL